MKKSKIQPASSVPCKQSENIGRFGVKEESGQTFRRSKIHPVSCESINFYNHYIYKPSAAVLLKEWWL